MITELQVKQPALSGFTYLCVTLLTTDGMALKTVVVFGIQSTAISQKMICTDIDIGILYINKILEIWT